MFTGRAKPIRIIGDPGNHLPDNWISTGFYVEIPLLNKKVSK
jgi:hypothetical protein